MSALCNSEYPFCIPTQFIYQYFNLVFINMLFLFVLCCLNSFFSLISLKLPLLRSGCYVLYCIKTLYNHLSIFYVFGLLNTQTFYLCTYLLHFVLFLPVSPLKVRCLLCSVPKILKLPFFVCFYEISTVKFCHSLYSCRFRFCSMCYWMKKALPGFIYKW